MTIFSKIIRVAARLLGTSECMKNRKQVGKYFENEINEKKSFIIDLRANRNPSIYNIIRWVAWTMGQMNC